MIRMIFIALVVGLTVLCGASIGLYQYFGWKGLIAVPFLVVVMIWAVKKIIGLVFRKFATGLFGMKSGVLKGAALKVHSITPVAKPIDPEPEPEVEDSEEPAEDGAVRDEDMDEDESSEETVEDEDEEEGPKVYFDIDMTITPADGTAENVWEPSELALTSEKVSGLMDLAEKQVGSVRSLKVWNGRGFGPDEPGKYPGEQRLLATFEVKQGARNVWVSYYNEALGTVELPEWNVQTSPAVETGI